MNEQFIKSLPTCILFSKRMGLFGAIKDELS
jgi:hypothetical protein